MGWMGQFREDGSGLGTTIGALEGRGELEEGRGRHALGFSERLDERMHKLSG